MKQRQTLPILLKEQHILLIGGGNVALQKAEVFSWLNYSHMFEDMEIYKNSQGLANYRARWMYRYLCLIILLYLILWAICPKTETWKKSCLVSHPTQYTAAVNFKS